MSLQERDSSVLEKRLIRKLPLPQGQQTAPEESQERRCSQGWRNQAWLPGGCRRDLMWPTNQKAGKGPLQKCGERQGGELS